MTPDPRHIAAVQRLLRAGQGPFVPKPRLPVIDEAVATGCVLRGACAYGRGMR